MVIALIAAGCSSSDKDGKVRVGAGGGEFPFQGGLLVIPPGAVGEETSLRLEAADATIPGELGGLTASAGGAVEVELGSPLRVLATLRFHVSAPLERTERRWLVVFDDAAAAL
ncbi:MAG TPA: hypothetical protein VK988_23085 [Acidimicrobiales bacterium]|nr:hypothetical protein [Acidimicrobiales bacterium]